jgi:hypothetical protein
VVEVIGYPLRLCVQVEDGVDGAEAASTEAGALGSAPGTASDSGAAAAASGTGDGGGAVGTSERVDAGLRWLPLQLQLGLPLMPPELNELVCRNALVRRPTTRNTEPSRTHSDLFGM